MEARITEHSEMNIENLGVFHTFIIRTSKNATLKVDLNPDGSTHTYSYAVKGGARGGTRLIRREGCPKEAEKLIQEFLSKK